MEKRAFLVHISVQKGQKVCSQITTSPLPKILKECMPTVLEEVLITERRSLGQRSVLVKMYGDDLLILRTAGGSILAIPRGTINRFMIIYLVRMGKTSED
mgnify:CR=1 FL=1